MKIEILKPWASQFGMMARMIFFPVLIGIFLGGAVDHFVPRSYISLLLSGGGPKSIFRAAGLGLLSSACSHGVLALSMEIYKKGASAASTVAFLLAAPWSSLPALMLLFGLFGFKALWILLGAILIALSTGTLFQGLEAKGKIEKNPNSISVDEGFSIPQDIQRRWREFRWSLSFFKDSFYGILLGMKSLSGMILFWILLGLAMGACVGAYLPQEILVKALGPSFIGMLSTLGLAIVLEVCSEATAPLALFIYAKTAAFGNVFLFLMAGVVTDYNEISLLWANVGKKAALWMLAIGLPQMLFFAWLLNRIA